MLSVFSEEVAVTEPLLHCSKTVLFADSHNLWESAKLFRQSCSTFTFSHQLFFLRLHWLWSCSYPLFFLYLVHLSIIFFDLIQSKHLNNNLPFYQNWAKTTAVYLSAYLSIDVLVYWSFCLSVCLPAKTLLPPLWLFPRIQSNWGANVSFMPSFP